MRQRLLRVFALRHYSTLSGLKKLLEKKSVTTPEKNENRNIPENEESQAEIPQLNENLNKEI